ncbi:MAG: hypothetical protein J6C26_08965 [Clostridia bacterium]|nr:hypothetical protein [Clostridia bacterium]
MRDQYIDLMEKALSAYTDEHIQRYLNDVETDGLKEHGFPRLTANIGILIANGRRTDLLPLFLEMMDLCCDMFLRPYIRAANEFSVREIVCCIDEVERANAVDEERVLRWKQKISQIVPEACYDVVVKEATDRITNWAIFGAVSEYARVYFGLGDNLDFIDRQLSCQFQWLDENGMYRDNKNAIPHQPMVYDLVSRGLFTMLIHFGYRGKYYEQIDACLKKAGLLTLKMQSPNGEIPFGGRSNQFLHNEPWLAILFEYEANRYAKEGNLALAMEFKSAVVRALAVTEKWLGKTPIRHIKNRFPTETKYGCEGYAYFDKYMITAASFLYAAYLLCDDSVPSVPSVDHVPSAFVTTDYFHKIFLKSGGYLAEIDTNADSHYDASGLGRVHREGAPSTICLSVPCPSHPVYTLDVTDPMNLSICPGVRENGVWRFATDASVVYETMGVFTEEDAAYTTMRCRFSKESSVDLQYEVSADGVQIQTLGEGEVACLLPAFCFDGESTSEIDANTHSLSVSYEGWLCRYTTNGFIVDLKRISANRNGYYRAFAAIGDGSLWVKIQIEEQKHP